MNHCDARWDYFPYAEVRSCTSPPKCSKRGTKGRYPITLCDTMAAILFHMFNKYVFYTWLLTTFPNLGEYVLVKSTVQLKQISFQTSARGPATVDTNRCLAWHFAKTHVTVGK